MNTAPRNVVNGSQPHQKNSEAERDPNNRHCTISADFQSIANCGIDRNKAICAAFVAAIVKQRELARKGREVEQ